MTLTRREVLGAAGIAVGSCALFVYAMKEIGSYQDRKRKPVFPWRYSELDPDITAQRAYSLFDEGYCMYAVFKSVTSQLADKYGEPYRSFPAEMMRYGTGGVAGRGSLCGAINGSAALMSMFVVKEEEELNQLVNELFLWYEQSELPIYVPPEPALDIEITKSVSESVLCHVSVCKWCKASGHEPFTQLQVERCKRLTADTAKKTVEILNTHFSSCFPETFLHYEKPGEFTLKAQSEKPCPVLALCIICDGDHTKSEFQVTVKDIRLNPKRRKEQ